VKEKERTQLLREKEMGTQYLQLFERGREKKECVRKKGKSNDGINPSFPNTLSHKGIGERWKKGLFL